MVPLLIKIVAGFLVVTLCSAVIGIVTDKTVLSADYVSQQLVETKAYDHLASAITDELKRQPAVAANPQAMDMIGHVVTPAVLQSKIEAALPQMEAYYKGQSKTFTLDLSDIAQQVQQAGITLPPDSPLLKPITLSTTDEAKPASSFITGWGHTSMVFSMLLFVLLVLASWQSGRYGAIPMVAFVSGLLLCLLGVALFFGHSVLDELVKTWFDTNAFVSVGRDVATRISQDMGMLVGSYGLGLMLIGGLSALIVRRLQARIVMNSRVY
jgi:hypothetical protein